MCDLGGQILDDVGKVGDLFGSAANAGVGALNTATQPGVMDTAWGGLSAYGGGQAFGLFGGAGGGGAGDLGVGFDTTGFAGGGTGAAGAGAYDLGGVGAFNDYAIGGGVPTGASSAGGFGNSLFGSGGGGALGKLTSGMMLAGSAYGLYNSYQQRQMEKKAQANRQQYIDQLNNLTANPNQVTNMPGYKFGLDQGEKGLNRQLASQGLTGSGAQMQELQQFGQQYAGQFLNNEQARLASLAGMDMSPYQNNSANMGNDALNNLVMWSILQGRGQH